jgi:ribosomal protein S18 acetylase RimI-like enzyme
VTHTVRRIRADEWRQYRELRLEALADSPLAFVEQYAVAAARDDAYWRERVARGAADDSTATFVAGDGGLVGMATCLIEPDATGHVVGFYVTPAARGGGVADALMEAATRWAADSRGVSRIRLFVMETNARAEAFYRRLGFRRTGQTMAYPPDPSYTEYELVREVSRTTSSTAGTRSAR